MTAATPYSGPERRVARPSALLGALCALGVGAIAFATLCPAGLRPHIASADVERFGAYYVLGALLGAFLPRRWPTALAFVVFLAFGLEAGQLFVPGRDAGATDAVVKAFGGAAGVMTVAATFALRRTLSRALAAPAGSFA